MIIYGDKVIFSSGREKYANNGIIGLGPDMRVTEGYDGGFYNHEFNNSECTDNVLSKDDLCELADYMISEWERFKSLHTSNASDKS